MCSQHRLYTKLACIVSHPHGVLKWQLPPHNPGRKCTEPFSLLESLHKLQVPGCQSLQSVLGRRQTGPSGLLESELKSREPRPGIGKDGWPDVREQTTEAS
eukprot:s2085_g1.t1